MKRAIQERVILFGHFPFDFTIGQPVSVGYGVELVDSSPTLSLLDAQHKALVVPEEVAGTGQVYVCLKTEVLGSEIDADNRLWRALASMQLGGRLHWRATGVVTVNRQMSVIRAESFRAETTGRGREKPFSATEWRGVRNINVRITRMAGEGMERMRSAVTLWSQIACGKCGSWQLAMLGLIASIECCFPQPKNRGYDNLTYGLRLADRVYRFLKSNKFTTSHRKRLKRIYDTYRNSIAHGVHDPFIQGLRMRRQGDLEFLFEVARLVLLGMLAFQNNELKVLLPKIADSDVVQRALDGLGAARQKFSEHVRFGK